MRVNEFTLCRTLSTDRLLRRRSRCSLCVIDRDLKSGETIKLDVVESDESCRLLRVFIQHINCPATGCAR